VYVCACPRAFVHGKQERKGREGEGEGEGGAVRNRHGNREQRGWGGGGQRRTVKGRGGDGRPCTEAGRGGERWAARRNRSRTRCEGERVGGGGGIRGVGDDIERKGWNRK
jgi:hypothetical protein